MSAPTAIGGTLVRDPDAAAWRWRTGEAAPEVSDLTLADLAPSFRCACALGWRPPAGWRSAHGWTAPTVEDRP